MMLLVYSTVFFSLFVDVPPIIHCSVCLSLTTTDGADD
jgi:hypothetical protein